jgi:hypothetical protein
MITDFEKRVYNEYLATSRSLQNKPFKLRQDFSDFETDENYRWIKKLAALFGKFPTIKIKDFFAAPYKIYSETTAYALKYYCSPAARRVYTMYLHQKVEDADSAEVISDIKDSLVFILNFCKENNLTLDEYIPYQAQNMSSFLLHLKSRSINIYVLFGFQNFEEYYYKLDKDLRDFMFFETDKKMPVLRTKYLASKKCKVVVQKGLEKLQYILNKNNKTKQ